MYEKIDKVNIELTDKCNSRCPQCHRTDAENNCRPHKWIQNIEWTFEDFKKAFPDPHCYPDFYFCGTFGDPLMCSDLYEIVKYIMENSKSQVMLSTNGSVRDEDWWFIFSQWGDRVRVNFAIDGLIDTNHLYRVGTSFKKIMRNAQAFIDGKGHANWTFIVFKHNQHQVEEAKQLSLEMEFKAFEAVKSERWNSSEDDDFHTYNYKGKQYRLDPPTTEYKHEKTNQWTEQDKKEKIIDCYAIRDKEVWIDCNGYVTPCCFYQNKLYRLVVSNKNTFDSKIDFHITLKQKLKSKGYKWTTNQTLPWDQPYWQDILKETMTNDLLGGLDNINIFKNSLEEINQSYFFNNYITDYVWKNKLNPCYNVCGKGIQKGVVTL